MSKVNSPAVPRAPADESTGSTENLSDMEIVKIYTSINENLNGLTKEESMRLKKINGDYSLGKRKVQFFIQRINQIR